VIAPSQRLGVDWIDVERFRESGRRVVAVREVSTPAVVLGSTQDEGVVDRRRAARAGIAVVRRRSGGGAVLVGPGDPWWFDLWIPRDDPLFVDDVGRAPLWVGECWLAALGTLGLGDPGRLRVHRGASVRTPLSDLVCFAGAGPGEVLAADPVSSGAGRKVVGVAQWRGRQGALFHTAAYRRWDPVSLTELLAVPEGQRTALVESLTSSAIGLEELTGAVRGPGAVTRAFLDSLPGGAPWAASSQG